MKSKRAKEYIRKTCDAPKCRFELDCKGYNEDFSQSDLHTNCRKRYQAFRDGYEKAEQDARERAANAFCAICCDPCNASKEDQELCAGCYSDLAKFLKAYDDGTQRNEN